MKEEIRNNVIKLTLLLVASMFGGYFIYKTFFPEHYFSWYPYIIVFYFVLGVVSIVSISKATVKDGNSYYRTFMLLQTLKLMSVSIVGMLYAFLVGEKVVSFFVSFFLFYVIYLVFETRVSIKLNNKFKNEFTQKK